MYATEVEEGKKVTFDQKDNVTAFKRGKDDAEGYFSIVLATHENLVLSAPTDTSDDLEIQGIMSCQKTAGKLFHLAK